MAEDKQNCYESDFTEDRKFSRFKMDEAWEQQAELAYKWGRKYADAAKRRDEVQQERKVIKAELDTEYRATFEENGIKITEPAIDAAIRQDDRHKEVTKRLIDAEEEVLVFEAAKWAMQDRRAALEYESELWMNGYWGDPKQPVRRVVEEKTREELREGRRSRSRG